jgi:hypothetical protein
MIIAEELIPYYERAFYISASMQNLCIAYHHPCISLLAFLCFLYPLRQRLLLQRFFTRKRACKNPSYEVPGRSGTALPKHCFQAMEDPLPCNILDTHLGSHGTISNDLRYWFFPYLSTT